MADGGWPGWLDRVRDRTDTDPHDYFTRFAVTDAPRRTSAVLMLFGPGAAGAGDVVLTQRSAKLRSHPGQVSFPGGAIDATDSGPVAAALREAHEEVGLDPHSVDVVAALPSLYLQPSGFSVAPVLAWWRQPGPIGIVDEREVARVVRAPLPELVDPANRFTVTHPMGFRGPGFEVGGLFVWGFTAMLLSTVLDVAGIAPEWDETRTRPIPKEVRPSMASLLRGAAARGRS